MISEKSIEFRRETPSKEEIINFGETSETYHKSSYVIDEFNNIGLTLLSSHHSQSEK